MTDKHIYITSITFPWWRWPPLHCLEHQGLMQARGLCVCSTARCLQGRKGSGELFHQSTDSFQICLGGLGPTQLPTRTYFHLVIRVVECHHYRTDNFCKAESEGAGKLFFSIEEKYLHVQYIPKKCLVLSNSFPHHLHRAFKCKWNWIMWVIRYVKCAEKIKCSCCTFKTTNIWLVYYWIITETIIERVDTFPVDKSFHQRGLQTCKMSLDVCTFFAVVLSYRQWVQSQFPVMPIRARSTRFSSFSVPMQHICHLLSFHVVRSLTHCMSLIPRSLLQFSGGSPAPACPRHNSWQPYSDWTWYFHVVLETAFHRVLSMSAPIVQHSPRSPSDLDTVFLALSSLITDCTFRLPRILEGEKKPI